MMLWFKRFFWILALFSLVSSVVFAVEVTDTGQTSLTNSGSSSDPFLGLRFVATETCIQSATRVNGVTANYALIVDHATGDELGRCSSWSGDVCVFDTPIEVESGVTYRVLMGNNGSTYTRKFESPSDPSFPFNGVRVNFTAGCSMGGAWTLAQGCEGGTESVYYNVQAITTDDCSLPDSIDPINISGGSVANNSRLSVSSVNYSVLVNSSGLFNCSFFYDSSLEYSVTDQEGGVGVLVNYSVYYDSSFSGNVTYLFNCTGEGGVVESTPLYTVNVDNVAPDLVLNGGNAFDSSNNSLLDSWVDSVPVNVSAVGDSDLFGFELSVFDSASGDSVFYYKNESLEGSVFDFYELINFSGFSGGLYLFNFTVSDSHTRSLIGDYGVDKPSVDALRFRTVEGNDIRVVARGGSRSDSVKSFDRYSLDFSFPKGVRGSDDAGSYVFDLFSDRPLVYMKDSGYKAHFVVWNPVLKRGNWVDFENSVLGDFVVEKVSDYHYVVEFFPLKAGVFPEKVVFSSIGGLNVQSYVFEWERSVSFVISDDFVVFGCVAGLGLAYVVLWVVFFLVFLVLGFGVDTLFAGLGGIGVFLCGLFVVGCSVWLGCFLCVVGLVLFVRSGFS